ncbi:hypothetical protein NUACC21_79570 [Scytonema sp. NUACC21]
MSQSESSKPDYAALVKAVSYSSPTPPDWLAVGQLIYSPTYGFGQVIGVLGSRLIVDFEKLDSHVSFSNWQNAVESENIVKAEDAPVQAASPALDLKQICHPVFFDVALELANNLKAVEMTPPSDGELYPLPDDLPAALRTALLHIGINQIYSHQLESLTALRSGKDISILTPTASGKTWCFNIGVVESCLTSDATALYLYPLKALAVDQIGKLR